MKELLNDCLYQEIKIDTGSITRWGELVSVTDSYLKVKNSDGTYVYPFTAILEIYMGHFRLTIRTIGDGN